MGAATRALPQNRTQTPDNHKRNGGQHQIQGIEELVHYKILTLLSLHTERHTLYSSYVESYIGDFGIGPRTILLES